MSSQYPVDRRPSTTSAMVAHLGGILTVFYVGWVASLVVYVMERDRSPVARESARVALNFQLTALIAVVALTVLAGIPLIGFLGAVGIVVVGLATLVLSVLGAVAASQSRPFRYPVALELVR